MDLISGWQVIVDICHYSCSGYGSWIVTTHQEQLISFIQSTGPGEHPLRAALKPRYITSQHIIHHASVGGDYLPENSI